MLKLKKLTEMVIIDNVNHRFLVFMLAILLPLSICAQAIPKRDKSKDIVITHPVATQRISRVRPVVAKKSKQNNKTRPSKAYSRRRKSKVVAHRGYKRVVVKTPRKEELRPTTYLYVNGSTTPIINVNSDANVVDVPINTNGRNWDFSYVGSWYSVAQESHDEMRLYITKNPFHNERKDYFFVSTGDKAVEVSVVQEAKPINVKGRINYATLSNNVFHDSNMNIEVNVNFSVSEGADLSCYLVGFLLDSKGYYLNAPTMYSSFSNSEGKFMVSSQSVYPSSDDALSFNTTLYIPKDVIQTFGNKKQEIQLELYVYCINNEKFISDKYVKRFKVKNNGRIITYED